MKFRYIIAAAVAALTLAVSCQKEGDHYLNNVKVSSSYVALEAEGGSTTITVNANDAWEFTALDEKVAAWLSISPMSGAAGESTVTFTAVAATSTQETTVFLTCAGETQRINVLQMTEKTELAVTSCNDFNTKGVDGVTYRLQGAVTKITESATYGNFYINDGTGADAYIYGTKFEGQTKQGALEKLGIAVGDEVLIEGIRDTYNGTVEIKDVDVISVKKALLKLPVSSGKYEKEAQDFDVKVAYKGASANVQMTDAISAFCTLKSSKYVAGVATKKETSPADTMVFTFHLAENTTYAPRSGEIAFSSTSGKDASNVTYAVTQMGIVPPLSTIADALKDGVNVSYVEGVIMAKCNQGYVISDASGSILVYWGSAFVAKNYYVGNTMGVSHEVSAYNFGPQLSSPYYETRVQKGSTPTYPTPVEINEAKLTALNAAVSGKNRTKLADAVAIEYIKLTATVAVSGNYINLTIDGSTVKGSVYQPTSDQKTTFTDLNGKKVNVTGYMTSLSTDKTSGAVTYINFVPVTVEEVK